MRRRHRRAGEVGERLSRRRVSGLRREACDNIDAGGGDIGFQDVGHRCRPARRKRGHDVAGFRLGQQKTVFEARGNTIARIDLCDDQVAVSLTDHDSRYIDQIGRTIHDDRVARNVIDDDCRCSGIFRIGDLGVETAATALDQGDVAGDLRRVDEGLTRIRRRPRGTIVERIVIIVSQNQVLGNRAALRKCRRKVGLLHLVQAGNGRW